ncbi:Microspherule protein 1 [Nymphon striatum]|nr:Microspherule protein 1 [Nymphon striatum]
MDSGDNSQMSPGTHPHSSLSHLSSSSNPASPILSSMMTSMSVPQAGPSSPASSQQKRRSSCRSIKRKKFDDELVESSLFKSNARGHHHKGSLLPSFPLSMTSTSPGPTIPISGVPISCTSMTISQPATGGTSAITALDYHSMTEYASSSITSEKKKASKSAKRPKRQKNQSLTSKDIGRWKAADDLMLIIAVQQTNDLQSVHRGVKFSCKFTLQEIQERWYALLYHPVISKMAVNGMKQLHSEIVNNIKSKCLFSKQEEKLLINIPSTPTPEIEKFQELLNSNPDVFYPSRTAKSLYSHWTLLKQNQLLTDQTVQPLPRGDNVLNFSDAEDYINDSELQYMSMVDRRVKKEIRTLESEIPRWRVLLENVTGCVSSPDFDDQTVAVLRGRLVRYLMRSREITLGRQAKDNLVDVDLSLEGPAWKISRKQGIIKLDSNGDFFICNEGKRPIFIDSKPVLTGNKFKLNHNSVVEISNLKFVFLQNQDIINQMRAEACKTAAL